MRGIAIQVVKISKLYRISEGGGFRYLALRDVLADTLKGPLRLIRKEKSSQRKTPDYIWALKDVDLEIGQGEIVGLIGRNGAGKTTLLKILSRITKPSSGCAQIQGRIGSLLEVGTGFHPELSGRENIYLSGSILGMMKREIQQKFDEIVEFAGVERFLDTPAKHYSSGMYTRLAFAVAAHLEPEILLVDEVLAVGDLEFQKKCLGKMREVSQGGRTVVFVSHQMNQIRRLCERAVWLEGGQIRQTGSTAEVVSAYETAMTSRENGKQPRSDGPKPKARFLRWEIVEPGGENPHQLVTLGPVTVKFILEVNEPVQIGHHGITLFGSENQMIWGTAADNLRLSPGHCEFVYTLPFLPLRPGIYFWHLSLYDGRDMLDIWDSVPELVVATRPMGHRSDEWSGLLNMPCQFSINGDQWKTHGDVH